MKNSSSFASGIAALLLAACSNPGGPVDGGGSADQRNVAPSPSPPPPSPEPAFGVEEEMAGIFATRFEYSDFNGCWLSMSREASADFRARFPPDSANAPQRGRSYRLEVIGKRSVAAADTPPFFGHMGGWRCEIMATRIVSVEVVAGEVIAGGERP